MLVLKTIAEVRAWRSSTPAPVGLVPTMGYLHEGHLSLVRLSRAADAATIVSIFVNPTQFGPNEDLDRYPRDLDRDLSFLESEGVAAAFAPTAAEIYPAGFETRLEVRSVAEPLEGAWRSGHFPGVAAIVAKLFNIVQPQRAYFGQKDAQQLAVIRRLILDLNFPVEIVAAPIVREADGLAMSSRNAYLTAEERTAALVLNGALQAARHAFDDGLRNAEQLRDIVQRTLASEPLAVIDYVSIADATTMQEIDEAGAGALVSLAVRIGSTRLIDNTIL